VFVPGESEGEDFPHQNTNRAFSPNLVEVLLQKGDPYLLNHRRASQKPDAQHEPNDGTRLNFERPA
jgi:hypothetical protein